MSQLKHEKVKKTIISIQKGYELPAWVKQLIISLLALAVVAYITYRVNTN